MSNFATAWTYSDWYQPADLEAEELEPEPWPAETLFVSAGAVAWSFTDDDPELI